MFKLFLCLLFMSIFSIYAQGSPTWNGKATSTGYFLPVSGSTDAHLKPSYDGKTISNTDYYGWTWVYNDTQKNIQLKNKNNTPTLQWNIEIDPENPAQFIYGENENSSLTGQLLNNGTINFYLDSCSDNRCNPKLLFTTTINTFKS
ncbi:MAG TPA: hypothetical protein PKC21_07535 [Oligoflexia bacterium]|nr:hypothetical protein [Oligoflexia bacterium]HMR25188.1 hypothetical protein [Oligoflexia bacterium]